ncbi:MAG: hypothetical protein ABIN37_07930, partial [Burkholderiaceae bacterium]
MHLCNANSPSQEPAFSRHATALIGALLAFAMACADAVAQQNKEAPILPSVMVTAKANGDPVEKSYRKIIRGMDLFEAQHHLAPAAALRFKLLARKRDTDMQQIEMNVLGSSVDFPVLIAPDNTFALERIPRAFDEDA